MKKLILAAAMTIGIFCNNCIRIAEKFLLLRWIGRPQRW